MDSFKIKHKEFEILEIIKDDAFKCSYKNKVYFIKKYDLENSDSRLRFNMAQRIGQTNVCQPKLKLVDKKSGYIVKEFIEGTLISDYILDHDFDDNIYKKIFLNAYMARVVGLTLDFSLDKWMLVGQDLYYVDDFCDKYNPNNDFTKAKLSQWFFTKDLLKFYENNGILFDKTRIKEEYAVNKEMVLTTCKYYQ